jgi:hypothetical protein
MTNTPASGADKATDERALFEAWYIGDERSSKAIERSGDGYKLMHASNAWSVWKARAALAAGAPVQVSAANTDEPQVYADANRFQLLKKTAFNRIVNGFNGKVLTWTLTLPADEYGDGTLEEAVDALAAYHDFKPTYPVPAAPAGAVVARPDLANRLHLLDTAIEEVRALIPQRLGAEHLREKLQSIVRRAAHDQTTTGEKK